MEFTSDTMSFITRYARTALDLILFLRPKQFVVAGRTHPDSYLEPLPFLFVSLGLSTFVGSTFALILLEGEELATLERIGIVGVAVIIAAVWLINLSLVFIGKMVASLLHIDLTLQQSFDAYCYSSVFFPLYIASSQAAFFTYTEPHRGLVVFTSVVQLLLIAFLVSMMARLARTTRAKRAVFVTVMPITILGVGLLVSWSAAMSGRNAALKEARPGIELVSLQPGDAALNSDTCTSAMLYGTLSPDRTRTIGWFEWGLDSTSLAYITPEQAISRNSRFRQVLKSLPSATTFYYRAVAWNANGSSVGKILSFTTPQCTH